MTTNGAMAPCETAAGDHHRRTLGHRLGWALSASHANGCGRRKGGPASRGNAGPLELGSRAPGHDRRPDAVGFASTSGPTIRDIHSLRWASSCSLATRARRRHLIQLRLLAAIRSRCLRPRITPTNATSVNGPGPIALVQAMGCCVRRRMAHKPHLTRLSARRHDLWHSDRSNPAGLPNSARPTRESRRLMWNTVA